MCDPESKPDPEDEDNPIGRGANGDGDEVEYNDGIVEHNDGIVEHNEMQDQIAEAMWTQYLEEHICHGVPMHI